MIRKVVLVSAVMVVAACRSSTEALLVRVDSETAGDNCAQGGLALRTGYDANNSNTLDDSEIDATKTKYVCNGANGSTGQTGQNGEQGDAGVRGHDSLNKVSAEAAGTNCENGGSKVETGLDVNDNGTLEAGEVTSTSYVCSQSSADDYFFGDITIRNDDDIAALAGKRVVFGSLVIEHATAGVFTLPALEAVTNSIVLGNEGGGEGPALGLRALTPVRELHFPKLVSVGSLSVGSYDDVTVLDVPLLARAGDINLIDLAGLTSASFPALKSVSYFRMNDADAVTSLSMPVLADARLLELQWNDALATVTVPVTLFVTDEIDVYENPLLSDCFAHRLLLNGTSTWGNDIHDNLPTAMCVATDVCRPVTVTGLSKFHMCGVQRSFTDAQTLCATLGTGAALAWFESTAEWRAFSDAVYDGDLQGEAWVGYSDEATEGVWVASGGPATYSPMTETDFWAPPNEPNDTTHMENAVEINWDGRANDAPATILKSFYCRAP